MLGPSEVKLILVEDDIVDAEAIHRAFRNHRVGNEIIHVSNGEEALQLMRGSATRAPLSGPYMMLLDLNMPRMGGLELLEIMRNDPKLRNTVVFVLTTSEAEEDKASAYSNMVAGYLVKDSVGQGFIDLVAMLECYWKVVQFPTAFST